MQKAEGRRQKAVGAGLKPAPTQKASKIGFCLLLTAVCLLLTACGQSSNGASATPTPSQQAVQVSPTAAPQAAGSPTAQTSATQPGATPASGGPTFENPVMQNDFADPD